MLKQRAASALMIVLLSLPTLVLPARVFAKSPADCEEGFLVKKHEALVQTLIRQYRRMAKSAGVPQAELLNVGRLGLLNAIRTFDPSKGSLATWARWQILAEVSKLLQSYGLNRPEQLMGDLDTENASFEDLTEGVDLFGEPALNSERLVGQAEREARVRDLASRYLSTQSERNQRLFQLLILPGGHTQTEVAAEFGVSRSRVQQIEARMTKQFSQFVLDNY